MAPDNSGSDERGPLPDAEGLWTEGRTADVSDETMPSWESQAAQYPRIGPPGISYSRGKLTESYFVDCLLFRDDNGELVGIANHYPADFLPYEREGNVNVWVRPDRRGQGIGSQLALEAMRRWPPPEREQLRYTKAGLKWVTALGKKYADTDMDFRPEGWEAWRDRVVKGKDS